MNKATLLFKTAEALETTTDYRWSDPRRCNLAIVVEVARGARPSRCEFLQGGNAGLRVGTKSYVVWCRAGADNHVVRWLKSEFGFTSREIESIELLNDHRIVRELARRGIRPAPMFNRSRRYVAAYLAAMARRERNRARHKPPILQPA